MGCSIACHALTRTKCIRMQERLHITVTGHCRGSVPATMSQSVVGVRLIRARSCQCAAKGHVALWLTWKEKGKRMVLKPISLMRHATVSKFWVMALGPCHSPSTDVEPVSKPNLQIPEVSENIVKRATTK